MKKILKSTIEIIGGILAIALIIILFWLFLVITPDELEKMIRQFIGTEELC